MISTGGFVARSGAALSCVRPNRSDTIVAGGYSRSAIRFGGRMGLDPDNSPICIVIRGMSGSDRSSARSTVFGSEKTGDTSLWRPNVEAPGSGLRLDHDASSSVIGFTEIERDIIRDLAASCSKPLPLLRGSRKDRESGAAIGDIGDADIGGRARDDGAPLRHDLGSYGSDAGLLLLVAMGATPDEEQRNERHQSLPVSHPTLQYVPTSSRREAGVQALNQLCRHACKGVARPEGRGILLGGREVRRPSPPAKSRTCGYVLFKMAPLGRATRHEKSALGVARTRLIQYKVVNFGRLDGERISNGQNY